jgi:phosphoesterase RecJ-like protein
MGIYTDTGGFKYLKDPVPTLEIVGELAKFARDYPNTIFTLENSNKKQKLIFEGLALLSIKEFFNGIVAVASVSRDDLVKNNINKEDIIPSIISNQLKSVISYDIGIVMVEEDKDMVKLSIRTRDSNKYDVSKLAVSLGGGGHMAAAGARLNMNIQNAIDKVVENIKVIYNL